MYISVDESPLKLPNMKKSILLFFIFIFHSSPSTFCQVEIVQEAELNFTYTGQGTPAIKPRSSASNLNTLYVTETDGKTSWEINIPIAGNYKLVVDYSNDNSGQLDSSSVWVNGIKVYEFECADTGNGGNGWNNFVESSEINLGNLPEGIAIISLRLDYSNNGVEYDRLTISSDVVNLLETLNRETYLSQNYPNPFHNLTTIRLYLPVTCFISLKIYDMYGKEVKTLVNENVPQGNRVFSFDATGLTSDTYFYKLQIGDFNIIKKMILLK